MRAAPSDKSQLMILRVAPLAVVAAAATLGAHQLRFCAPPRATAAAHLTGIYKAASSSSATPFFKETTASNSIAPQQYETARQCAALSPPHPPCFLGRLPVS